MEVTPSFSTAATWATMKLWTIYSVKRGLKSENYFFEKNIVKYNSHQSQFKDFLQIFPAYRVLFLKNLG